MRAYVVFDWILNQLHITIVDGDATAKSELSFWQARELRDAIASRSMYEVDDDAALLHWNPNDGTLLVRDLACDIPREVELPLVTSMDGQNAFSTKPDEL